MKKLLKDILKEELKVGLPMWLLATGMVIIGAFTGTIIGYILWYGHLIDYNQTVFDAIVVLFGWLFGLSTTLIELRNYMRKKGAKCKILGA